MINLSDPATMTDKQLEELKAEQTIYHEAFELLRIINAEFQSDPMSVQCFDLRVVERVKNWVERYDEAKKSQPYI